VFCWLKKYWFLAPVGFLTHPYLTVGLSYVFFRVMHLVIDAADNPALAALRPLSYTNYVLNFTCLIAGPIQRYEDFIQPAAPLDLATCGRALERIVIGLFKVTIAAPALSAVHIHATQWLLSTADVSSQLVSGVLSICAYPVFLYLNFSGYVDIVVGVARFIGLELPENFNRPFAALNFMDFWARYHMTLSNWLRDYVYTPFLRVLMTRFTEASLDPFLGALAFFVTFLLIGMWHGPTLMFALYGLLLAIGISANKLYQVFMVKRWGRTNYRNLSAKPVYQACCRGLTFTWYALSMVCFWASGGEATRLLNVFSGTAVVGCVLLLFLAATLCLSALTQARASLLKVVWNGTPLATSRCVRTVWATIMIFVCVAFAVLTKSPAPEIVYRAF
jgi:alginate O-acetyltransferase complex protein AlgI